MQRDPDNPNSSILPTLKSRGICPGQWSLEEKERFKEAEGKFGWDPVKIALHVMTRSVDQVKNHKKELQK